MTSSLALTPPLPRRLARGAGALFIADSWGWFAAFGAMAALVCVGVATILASPEPERSEPAAAPAGAGASAAERPAAWLRAHMIEPFAGFSRPRGWAGLLLFLLF